MHIIYICPTKYQFIHYPMWIIQTKSQKEIAKYSTEKFVRFNKFLVESKLEYSVDQIIRMSKEDRNKFAELCLRANKPKGT